MEIQFPISTMCIAGRNFMKRKLRLACWSMAFVCRDVSLSVCMFVCSGATGHNSRTIFKLHMQIGEESIRFSRSWGQRSTSRSDHHKTLVNSKDPEQLKGFGQKLT